MAGDAGRYGAEDRPPASDLHGRRPARLRAHGPAREVAPLPSELVERIREGYEAFSRGDFDTAIDGIHPDMEWVVLDMMPDTGPFIGQVGVRRFWQTWADAFDEFHAEPEQYADAGDAVVVISRIVGRMKDSGATIETPSFPMVWTARDQMIVRVEMFADRQEALAAVGLPADTEFSKFAQPPRRSEPEAP